MICYRDRMFCSAICDTTWCDRNFSPAVAAKAEEWWKGFKSDRPVPVQFRDLHVGCVEYREPQGRRHPEGVDNRRLHDMVSG
jgi:hypothetical protein